MNKNNLLYNASMALVECVKFIRPVDKEFVQIMLDKAQEYTNQIAVDEVLEKEVDKFEQQIRKGIE